MNVPNNSRLSERVGCATLPKKRRIVASEETPMPAQSEKRIFTYQTRVTLTPDQHRALADYAGLVLPGGAHAARLSAKR